MTLGTLREDSQGRSAMPARTGGRQNRVPTSHARALRPRSSASLRQTGSFCNHFHTDRVRDARNNGILHLQEVGPVLVKLVSPDMCIALGIDELDIHTQPVAIRLHATF